MSTVKKSKKKQKMVWINDVIYVQKRVTKKSANERGLKGFSTKAKAIEGLSGALSDSEGYG
jgi:hypothetical protein